MPSPSSTSSHPNLEALAETLSATLRGEAFFDEGSRALYATDASNYRQVPLGVVRPKDAEDVVQTVRLAREHDVPILPRGTGTSLAGQATNEAVVLDMSRHMNRLLEIDPETRRARVEPGIPLDNLRRVAQKKHDLTFGPDPSTHVVCSLGGMIGNNACGVHSVATGKTLDYVEELEILTYDGTRMTVGPTSKDELQRIIRQGGRRGDIYQQLKQLRDRHADRIREAYPDIPRPVSGYSLYPLLPENGFNVAQALTGTEGTCAVILEATLKLVPHPKASAMLILGFSDIYEAADHVPQVLELEPSAVEGVDGLLVEYMNRKNLYPEHVEKLPEGEGWLFIEFAADSEAEVEEKTRHARTVLEKESGTTGAAVFLDEEAQEGMWEVRESALGATAHVPGRDSDAWEGWEDTAVHPEDLGAYLRDLNALMEKYGYSSPLYGHFGDGLVHLRVTFDLVSQEGIDTLQAFVQEAAELVVRYDGSLSGEHGDGQARAELLSRMFGDEMMQAFRTFKTIWDPKNRMNPGKVVEPYGITDNLRLGPGFKHPDVDTHFAYPEDEGSFGRATMRCVGVGECRKMDTGTMCPSYQVLEEEKHTTRGRAHLLFEMLHGDALQNGWKDETVKEALDLCLSCKGCKGECPVQVDVATYKAEFLAHYYEDEFRPMAAYTMGLIYWWARLASLMPQVANFFTQTPVLRDLFKALGGIAPERELPAFAAQTFKQRLSDRNGTSSKSVTNGATSERQQVVLFADTFTNHFEPTIGIAAAEVLEAAGYEVLVPKQSLCCGRPLYEFGMLKLARRQLRRVLDALRPQIRAGRPFVVLEPSCAATFRDELYSLFPDDEDAQRLKRQTYTLAEFLEQEANGFEYPQLKRRAVVHGHCHEKSVLGMDEHEDVLKAMGLEAEVLDSGCCGVAGAFGYEKDKYELSMGCGERVLLPAVREADEEALVISNGFSCRTQIEQGTEREAVHLAEVLKMALDEKHASNGRTPPAPTHERDREAASHDGLAWKAGALGIGTALVGAAAYQLLRS